jgi:GTP-binding protein LepA
MQKQFDVEEISFISAKTGIEVKELLERVIEQVPCPSGEVSSEMRAFLFDSWYSEHQGVICLARLMDGVIKTGDVIRSIASGQTITVHDLGISRLTLESKTELYAGQVGFLALGMRKCSEARIGDTFCRVEAIEVAALPGLQDSKPMV